VVVRFEAELDGRAIRIEVTEAGGRYRVRMGDDVMDVDARRTAGGLWSLLVDGVS
jgi:hypothetical protein